MLLHLLHVDIKKISLNMGAGKKNATLAGLIALPCRIGEFSCVPRDNEEEKPLGPHSLSTTGTKMFVNYFWQMVICA